MKSSGNLAVKYKKKNKKKTCATCAINPTPYVKIKKNKENCNINTEVRLGTFQSNLTKTVGDGKNVQHVQCVV